MPERNLDEVSKSLSRIAECVSGHEQADFVTFSHDSLEPRFSRHIRKLPGMVAGAAMGGTVGEAVFGSALLSEDHYAYVGTLIVVIAERHQISIGKFDKVPFASTKGHIGTEHLSLLEDRCSDGSFMRELFVLPSPDISISDGIVDIKGRDVRFLPKSELIVDGSIFETPDLDAMASIIEEITGERVFFDGFLERLGSGELDPVKLLSGEHMLSDTQILSVLDDGRFFDDVVDYWRVQDNRDELVRQAERLPLELKTPITKAMQARGEGRWKLKAWRTLWIVLGVGWTSMSLIAFFVSPQLRVPDFSEILMLLSVGGISVVGSLYCSDSISKSTWFADSAEQLGGSQATKTLRKPGMSGSTSR